MLKYFKNVIYLYMFYINMINHTEEHIFLLNYIQQGFFIFDRKLGQIYHRMKHHWVLLAVMPKWYFKNFKMPQPQTLPINLKKKLI